MTKHLTLLMGVLCFAGIALSQHSFVVQNGTASVFNSLTNAYNAANSGDTIYLPGGEFNVPSNIDKSLVWIGVGHQPDSTSATYFTAIINNITFSGNCDNSYFTGIFFRENLSFGDTDNDAEYITITRCRLDKGMTLKKSPQRANINFKVYECYSGSTINGGNSSNSIIEKSVISGAITNFFQSYFDRNIFIYGKSITFGAKYVLQRDTNCLITNSIFIKYHTSVYESENNTFMNNLFAESIVFPQSTNVGINNIVGAGMYQFVDVLNATAYNYDNNYHLKPESPGKNAALDFTDIGLFGSDEPLKEGFLPFNPHIRSVNIDLKTNNGLLPVKISVAAQEN